MHDIFSPSFQTLFDRAISPDQSLAVQRQPCPHMPLALKEAFDSDSPVIIEGYSNSDLDENACCRELASRFGSVEVRIRAGDLASPQEYSNERIYESSTLAGYLVEMYESRGRPRYAGNIRLPEEILSIAGVTVPNCVPFEDLEPPSYWFGGVGCTTPLHKDSTDNFAVQVFGRKRWTIFPVRDAPNLYLSPPSDEPLHDYATSPLDWRSPDINQFPKALQTHPLSFEARKGDLLYLPAGWSHFVETIEPSLMINFWMSRNAFAERKLGWNRLDSRERKSRGEATKIL